MFYLLVLVAAIARFLPHPPNVHCICALGLIAGVYVPRRGAWLLPMAVLLVSDAIGHWTGYPGLGFYSPITMAAVYAGMAASVPIGRWVRRPRSVGTGPATTIGRWWHVPAASLSASTAFFVVSNLGVFLSGWYSMSLGGLAACYVAAIPFFGYSIVGDLAFSTLMFVVMERSRVAATLRRIAGVASGDDAAPSSHPAS